MPDSRTTDEPTTNKSMATEDVEAPTEDAEGRQGQKPGQPKKGEACFSERWCRNFSIQWTRTILKMKAPIVRLLLVITNHAATHPKTYVVCIILFSCLLLGLGFATNFNTELDQDNAWTPKGSRSLAHGEWIDDKSGFPEEPRWMLLELHADGENVLSYDAVQRIFQAVRLVRDNPKYAELCAEHEHPIVDQETGNFTCPIDSVMTFWNNSGAIFNNTVDNDDDCIRALSNTTYPSGETVDRQLIMGYAKAYDNNTMKSAQSLVVTIGITPDEDKAEPVEKDAIDAILDLQKEWAAEPNNRFKIEITAWRSFGDEFSKAIAKDLPLIPIVFAIMVVLCCLVFYKRDRVQSRSLLGFGAACTVLLAIMTGYGLLFIIGVPFSFLTQILPFIMFGIGLDDAFIIYGAYCRTEPSKDAAQRIHETIEDIGVSITLTTVTTVMAFALGCVSSIPAVLWLCLYAWPTILIDYIYQITFFIALLALDERRVKAKRKDCSCCCRAKPVIEENGEEESQEQAEQEIRPHFADRAMVKYGEFLLRRWVKVLVVVAFMALFGGCIYSTSQLEQYFTFTDLLPDGSYLISFWNAYQDYYERSGVRPAAYFRYVNVSDDDIQTQMKAYVRDLVDLPQITYPPVNFWLTDFDEFVNASQEVEDMPFNDQVDAFLNDTLYGQLYGDDIVRVDGTITASRVFLEMDQVDQDIVQENIDALEDQRAVSASQPINKGRDDWLFFAFDGSFYIWEFYAIAVEELTLTAILGVVAVSAIALVAIPHWSAIFFIAPLIIVLYIDLLGVIQFSCLYVNSVTYIGMVLSIGLIVDYTFHILLRYIETKGDDRETKVKESLRTIGASVFVGGFSTLLGVLPLAFSTSEIIRTVFVIFIGLVTLGLSHGLILLPVVLSLVGPLPPDPELHLEGDGGKASPAEEQPEGDDGDGGKVSPVEEHPNLGDVLEDGDKELVNIEL